MNFETFVTDEKYYPFWRIGLFERAFYTIVRRFNNYAVERLFNNDVFGFDVSYYQAAINFQQMKNYGARFAIPRCGYANVKDTRFDEYMTGVNGLLPIATYHYYDPIFSPIEQANKVISILQPYKSRIRRVWLDLEFYWTGSYSDPKHWKTYRDNIKSAGYKVGWYTRKTWWDSRVLTYAAEFASDPLWAAQYNISLTLIPKGWTKAMLWQSGTPSIGLAAGVTSREIDLDVWNDEFDFAAELGSVTPPPITITDGYQQVRAYNSDVHIWRGLATKIHVTDNQGALVRPSSFVHTGAKVIINGDGWLKDAGIVYHKPLSLAWSDGVEVQDIQFDQRPHFRDVGPNFFISHAYPVFHYNLVSGTRYSVTSGVDFFANSTNPEHVTELNPRTAIGFTQDGKIIVVVVDGRSSVSAGVTLKQLADVMIQAGAWYALELDGGDSSIMLLDGVKKSHNGDLINGVRTERATVNSVLIYADGGTMPTRYTATAIGNDTRTRPSHNTLQASNGFYPAGTKFYGDVVWIADATNKDASQYVGDMWLQIDATHWVAIIHQGKAICTYTDNGTPPATGKPAYIDMTLFAGSVVTVKDAVGNVLWTGKA